MAAFGALADSGRHFGSRLEAATLEVLGRQVLSLPDLVLRTAASQALGALNPPGTSVADVNRLLKQFADMKKMMRQLLQAGKGGRLPRNMPFSLR